MVNALLSYLPATVYEAKEIDMAIGYIRQLHFVHGYETIFLPEGAFRKLQTRIPRENEYVKKLPQRHKSDDKLVKEAGEILDRILWSLKKTDHVDAQLDSFLDIFSTWIRALSLKAVVVLPMARAIDSLSHFFHILVSDQRDFIGNLADDLELWLFSRFADVPIQWPYYLDFSNEIKETLLTRFDFDQFKDLRTAICKSSVGKGLRVERENMLLGGAEFVGSILEFAKTFHRDKIIITQSAIGASNDSILAFKELNWHHPSLMQVLEEPILNDENFASCFMIDRFYSSEFIKKMQPFGSLKSAMNPLVYYASFELACDKEVGLALENFRERKIKHIS